MRLSLPLLLVPAACAAIDPTLYVYSGNDSFQNQAAAFTCVGLFNRPDSPNTVYPDGVYSTGSTTGEDSILQDLYGIEKSSNLVTWDEFMNACFEDVAKGYILYDGNGMQTVVPNVLAMAAVLDAVPVDIANCADDWANIDLDKYEMLLDTTTEWSGFNPHDATEWVWDKYGSNFKGMAKMNPGWDQKSKHQILNPELTGTPNVGLVDWIVREKLFNFFLQDGCVPLTKEHRLFEKIVTNNDLPKPIAVWGYDNSIHAFGGSLYEAETTCSNEHNLGQIASEGLMNLAFFARLPPSEVTPPPNPHEGLVYDPSKVYVTFVVGDGDNMSMLVGRNFHEEYIPDRRSRCGGNNTDTCFPMVWSYNPHAFEVWPALTNYMFEFAADTNRDFFMGPPSGDLYAYPSIMDDESKTNFVANMEEDFGKWGSRASVHWEWFYSWISSVDNYFNLFGSRGATGFFLTTVPYMFPMPLFFQGDDYKVVGENKNVVLFKSNEWRGTDDTRNKESVDNMAAKLNALEGGSILHLYHTSDGGNTPENFSKLAPKLDDHVVIVNADTLIDMVIQKEKLAQ